MRKSWLPPPSLHLFLLVSLANIGETESVLLVGVHEGRLVKLPLANIYDNGGLCLGTDFPRIMRTLSGPQHRLSGAYEALQSATYNSDLSHHAAKCDGLFRWATSDEGKQITCFSPGSLIPINNMGLLRALTPLIPAS